MRLFAISTLLGGGLVLASNVAAAPDMDESWWAAIDPDGYQRIEVRCGTNFVDPRRIVVKAGVPVIVTFSAMDNLVGHRFFMQLPQAALDAPVASQRASFSFVPMLTGRYVAGCRGPGQPVGAPSDRAKQGLLTVVP